MKLLKKHSNPVYEAWTWEGFFSKSEFNHVLDFEEWMREHAPKQILNFKYRGNNLIYDHFAGEVTVLPGTTLVLIPDAEEPSDYSIDFYNSEMIKEYFDDADPE